VSPESAQFPPPAPEAAAATHAAHPRHDLEELQALAQRDRACDETVKVRVTQDDIRKLMSRRQKGAA